MSSVFATQNPHESYSVVIVATRKDALHPAITIVDPLAQQSVSADSLTESIAVVFCYTTAKATKDLNKIVEAIEVLV